MTIDETKKAEEIVKTKRKVIADKDVDMYLMKQLL